jgi:hypothetical protein
MRAEFEHRQQQARVGGGVLDHLLDDLCPREALCFELLAVAAQESASLIDKNLDVEISRGR